MFESKIDHFEDIVVNTTTTIRRLYNITKDIHLPIPKVFYYHDNTQDLKIPQSWILDNLDTPITVMDIIRDDCVLDIIIDLM